MTDSPADHPLTTRVRTAHGDSWALQGRLRAPHGGGALELPGVRLMASGIPLPQWNNGDVHDPAVVDVEAVRAFYAERGAPWGVRVPAGAPWAFGRLLFHKRCMTAPVADLTLPSGPLGEVTVRAATVADLETYAVLDAAVFGGDDVGPTREYMRVLLEAADAELGAGEAVRVVMAELAGRAAGVAYAIRTSTPAGGESFGIFGVGVLEDARRRGVGTALTAELLRWGAGTGADLAWLNPDDDAAAALYARLGFVESGGFDVYVDL